MKDPNFSTNNSYIKDESEIVEKIRSNFRIDDETKIKLIEKRFREIMEILQLDLEDHSLKDTPARVAKMYVKEFFSGLNSDNKPSVSLFSNKYNYREMLVEKNITLFSTCEHHFVPITGKVHIAYFPNENLIGLSKLNRIVQYYAKRPQQQEKLTVQIAEELMNILGTEDVAVFIEADHLCVKARGINDVNSVTCTSHYSGNFLNVNIKMEFLASLGK